MESAFEREDEKPSKKARRQGKLGSSRMPEKKGRTGKDRMKSVRKAEVEAEKTIVVVPRKLDPVDPLATGSSSNGEASSESNTSGTALQTIDQLQLKLDAASDFESLKQIEDGAAVIQKILHQQQEALDGLNRYAELDLRCQRKIGELLLSEVHRGRPAKRYHGGTFSGEMEEKASHTLPKWISKNKAARCRRLAEIPRDLFEQYIATTKSRSKLITRAGVLRMAGQHEKHKQAKTPETEPGVEQNGGTLGDQALAQDTKSRDPSRSDKSRPPELWRKEGNAAVVNAAIIRLDAPEAERQALASRYVALAALVDKGYSGQTPQSSD